VNAGLVARDDGKIGQALLRLGFEASPEDPAGRRKSLPVDDTEIRPRRVEDEPGLIPAHETGGHGITGTEEARIGGDAVPVGQLIERLVGDDPLQFAPLHFGAQARVSVWLIPGGEEDALPLVAPDLEPVIKILIHGGGAQVERFRHLKIGVDNRAEPAKAAPLGLDFVLVGAGAHFEGRQLEYLLRREGAVGSDRAKDGQG
jgi:hypothetical protein